MFVNLPLVLIFVKHNAQAKSRISAIYGLKHVVEEASIPFNKLGEILMGSTAL